MFQFRRFPSYAYFVQRRMTAYCAAGLPHSEIPGSMDICSSPRLFAACHVLLRLLMPRHSPCALSSLTCSSQSPLASVSTASLTAFRENSGRSLAPRLSPKTDFRRVRRWLRNFFRTSLRVSENSWFSLRIMQALQRLTKLFVPLHPSGCCSTINLYSVYLYTAPLCCLTLHFFALFSFQGADSWPLLCSQI